MAWYEQVRASWAGTTGTTLQLKKLMGGVAAAPPAKAALQWGGQCVGTGCSDLQKLGSAVFVTPCCRVLLCAKHVEKQLKLIQVLAALGRVGGNSPVTEGRR